MAEAILLCSSVLVIFSPFFLNVAGIKMLVNSIDPLPPYKVSDDLILELASITANVEDDPESAADAIVQG